MPKFSLVLSLLASLAASNASAADPSVVAITPGYSFVEYSGSAQVGRGDIDIDSTLFYIDEKVADGWKSWYLFFDPRHLQLIDATIHFDQPIHAVLTTKAQLDASNPTYGIDVDGDAAFNDYGTSRLIGLEPANTATWLPGGQDLHIEWSANDPGDHVRVLVAVPEPATYAQLATGLLALAVLRRRRPG